MIKMTINPQAEPKSFCFNQDAIIIGEGSPESVDICFPSEGLHQNHIKILYKENGYWVINQANDPFVTLNGQPFGKKLLQKKDVLQIRNHTLHIDDISLHSSFVIPPKEPEIAQESPPLEKEIPSPFPDVENLDFDENPESRFTSDLPPPKTTQEKPPAYSPSSDFTGKNPPLSSFIEEAYNLEEQKRPIPFRPLPKRKSSSLKKKIIKIAVLLSLAVCIFSGLVFTELFFRANNKSVAEEMLAAESIADYAMALTFAKTLHSGTQTHHFVDPSFIKNQLVELLPPAMTPCGNIDAQGQFYNCPYKLRYYMNHDFSRFLLIAQAPPKLLQWFMPQKVLVVDSNLMEVRKTDDLRALNRLLSDPSPLDGPVGDEITKAVLQTEIIPLDDIARYTGKREFSPPKALKYIKPGAENLIYNAPRYYQFGGAFLKKALQSLKSPSHAYEMAVLQNEMNAIAPYHDLIFYTTEGLGKAQLANKAINKIKPHDSFFTGYLLLSKKGSVINSHLVMNESLTEEPPLEKAAAEELDFTKRLKPNIGREEIIASFLKEQGEHAQELINPIFQNLHTVLENAIEKDSVFLPPLFFQLLEQYKEKEKVIWNDIQKTVASIRVIQPQVSDSTVERLLREYGLLDIYALPVPEEAMAGNSNQHPPIEMLELISDLGYNHHYNHGHSNVHSKPAKMTPPFLQ